MSAPVVVVLVLVLAGETGPDTVGTARPFPPARETGSKDGSDSQAVPALRTAVVGVQSSKRKTGTRSAEFPRWVGAR
ncbi:hypothetical protein GCM10010329_85270 [Streptomyces spiroverticillatus]|uniref:Uncharacterized protein n=1 Tax=Streptomyces finlayi TaxID=67296 RepID=A0A918X9D9_9ACTN|nr:hypothetical protein GCM10010329_85270 [Streptomyces spiroverticillatus]GHD19474.1 hypothetical protein GCM10010334_83160 [Streptomyces finlayi]